MSNAGFEKIKQRYKGVFFDDERLEGSGSELAYVFWLDVMGTQGTMKRSTKVTTNFVMRLHIVALETKDNMGLNIELFPVIDGIYVCTSDKYDLEKFIDHVFARLAVLFIIESNPNHRFMVRGAIAYGPVIKGHNALNCSAVLNSSPQNRDYTNRVLLGLLLIQSYEDEKKAAPFGVYLHESARAFAPPNHYPYSGLIYRWTEDELLVKELKNAVINHLSWCEKRASLLHYETECITKHKRLLVEHFAFDDID